MLSYLITAAGAPDSAPKAKKPKKSDEAAATTKPVKSPKATPTVPAPAESKSAKAKAARKQAADFFDTEETAAPEPAKQTKGKKGKAAAKTNGEAPVVVAAAVEVDVVEAQEKPKKQGKKGKAAVAEDAPGFEAPKEKATKAKKGKKSDVAPVEVDETPVQETVVKVKSKKSKGGKQEAPKDDITEVSIGADEEDEEAEVDDQTAALLAGFESDGDSDDPSEDLNFDDDVAVPALTKKQRQAVEKAEKAAKSNEPGVVYVGYVHLSVTFLRPFANPTQPRASWILRSADEAILLTVRPSQPPSPFSQQEDWRLQALRLCRVRIHRSRRHRRQDHGQLPIVRPHP